MRMRALWFLPLIIGCSASAPWEPPTRENPWVIHPFEWLVAQQNENGSWSDGTAPTVEGFDIGRVGITGIALLAVCEHGKLDSARKAADWLVSQQESDGSFRGSRPEGLDQAIGTLALVDGLDMVSLGHLKTPALAALAALMRLRRPDGTWGARLNTWWAFAALQHARFEEIPHDEKALADVTAYLDESFDRDPDFPTAVVPTVRHFKGSREKKRRSLPWVTARPPDPEKPDFPAWYFGSAVVYGISMNPDPEWRRWTERLMLALKETVHREGYWAGPDRDASIVRTSLVALLHRGYEWNRYAENRNVFGPKK
ncbi:MAG TPA: prenyltransferase/squalene oxidase repeat-containing protein [Planctomycetota bacterium]|nr:prenyltransferase/squalene oxidase repeat-containing protein [Planctomycetota bacterium]